MWGSPIIGVSQDPPDPPVPPPLAMGDVMWAFQRLSKIEQEEYLQLSDSAGVRDCLDSLL